MARFKRGCPVSLFREKVIAEEDYNFFDRSCLNIFSAGFLE
jgi:hypothetical protein